MCAAGHRIDEQVVVVGCGEAILDRRSLVQKQTFVRGRALRLLWSTMALPTKGRVIIDTTVGELDIELWAKVIHICRETLEVHA